MADNQAGKHGSRSWSIVWPKKLLGRHTFVDSLGRVRRTAPWRDAVGGKTVVKWRLRQGR